MTLSQQHWHEENDEQTTHHAQMSSSPPLEQHEDAASSTPRQALSPDTSPSRVTTVPTDALTGTSPLPVRSSTGRPHSVSSRSSPYSRPHSPARHTVGGEVVNIPRTAQYHAVGMPARHPLGVQSESMQSDDTSTESLESGGSTDGHSDIASSGSPTTVAMRRTHETVLATHAPHDATTRALGEDPLDRESRFLSPLGIDGDVYSGDENNDEASEAVGGSSISSAPGIGVSASDVQKADASLAAACSSGGAKDVASCPICLDTIREAFMTACGHSFCYRCISQHLCEHQSCPTCFQALDSDQIYPNFALNRLILRKSAEADGADALQRPASLVQQLRDSVQEGAKLDADEIDALLLVLQKKKQALRTSERRFEVLTMRQFLTTARARKMAAMDVLRKELLLVDEDMEYVCAQLDGCRRLSSTLQAEDTYTDSLLAKTRLVAPSVYGKQRVAEAAGAQVPNAQPGECSEGLPETPGDEPRNKRVDEHYSDLETFYFNSRMRNGALASEEGLGEFMETLTTVARHEKLRPVATLRYGDSTASTAIVASIEFDRDDEIFAVAGVTRKIKIYDYSNMMQQADIWNDLTQITRHRRMQQQQQQGAKQADRRHDWWARGEEEGAATAAEDGHASMPTALQYPLAEFTNRSKISCLSYNPYIKAQLACSDYDGTISLWDVNAGTPTMYLGEHEKRAWSVDFSQVDPTRLCSGSDDGKVKIWTTNRQASVMTIEGKANVCCVRFSPTHSNIMSFGSADHNVHCFDLRSPNQPLCVLRGHRKAVSYTRFLSPDEIVSASTDSSLKLWNLRTQECVRSFTGHTNEKNFVGLTTSGSEWIACGSENNTMYAYHRNLSHPVVVHRFGNCNSVTGAEQPEDDPSLFVSAVCWKKKSNTILSANSQGIIKVLDMA